MWVSLSGSQPAAHTHIQVSQPARRGQGQRKQLLRRKPGRLKAIRCPSERGSRRQHSWLKRFKAGRRPASTSTSTGLHVQREVKSLLGEMKVKVWGRWEVVQDIWIFFLFFKNGFFFLTRNKILSLWCLSRQIYMLKICDILAWNGGGWILFVLSLE